MYYFDNEFLQQYLGQDVHLKVFVDSEYYSVADPDDIDDPAFGVGYDLNGNPKIFDYRDVQQVKVGERLFTIDQLNDKMGVGDAEGGEESPEAGEEPPAPEGGEGPGDMGEEPPSPEGGPEAPPEGAEEPPAPEGGEEAPPEEEEPPNEAVRHVVRDMVNESRDKEGVEGYDVGIMVENIDKKNEYCGSRGVITESKSHDNIKYRVFNYGYTFKPGDIITCSITSLKRAEV